MSLLTDAMGAVTTKVRATPVPKDVEEKVRSGKVRLRQVAPEVNECLEFWRNKQYVYRTQSNTLTAQNTTPNRQDGTGHRIRQARNMIQPIVRREVSAATQRVPSYDVVPSTNDPKDVSAAKISEKVALYGYDDWGIKQATKRVATYAIVAPGGGFAWPYYEDNGVTRGNICVRVYGPAEVSWEPGIKFEDSRWYYVEQARAVDEVKSVSGFDGLPLTPDADKSETLGDQKRRESNQNLVLVGDFLERPSRDYPAGRRLTIANNRVIVPPEDYPLVDSRGEPMDEPVLHKLAYITDPEADRDLSLVQFLLDPQRSYNNANNKQQQWVDLAMNPQVIVKNGKLKQRLTDAPGATYNFVGQGDVVWRPVPQMPPDLEAIKQQALADMLRIASQNDIPEGLDAAKALQTWIENDQNVRQDFLDSIAAFHARLMRHCLILVQLYFDTPRLLQINGEWGPDPIEDFTGAQLRDQSDVRVATASITPLTREAMAQRITLYMQQGWVDPMKGMAAIEDGTPELIIDDYERDKATAHRIVQLLVADPQMLLNDPLQTAGPMGMPIQVPSWMPREFDNLGVIEHEFTNWMKSDQYWRADPVTKEAANLYYQGIQWLKAQKQMQAQQALEAQAMQLGAQNAAKPGEPKVLPSQPKLGG